MTNKPFQTDSQIEKKLDPLIDDFLVYIESEKGLSHHTKEAYQRDLESLYDFLHQASSSASPKRLSWPPTYDGILAYMKHLHELKMEPSSQARKLMAIKVFMRFLFREEIVDKNISDLLESPKLWQTLPTVLGYHEIELLIKAPDHQSDEGIRDRAILELLYGTGLRVSELCGLSIYDVSDDVIRVKGKGGKERVIPIGKPSLQAIDSYLAKVRCKFDSEHENALFVNSRGSRVTREFVWKRVKFYAEKVGLQKSISPHTFRHTYASHLLDGGADLRVIQELLGHAHISSTDRYTHLSKSQIQEVFYTFHPRWESEKDKEFKSSLIKKNAPSSQAQYDCDEET